MLHALFAEQWADALHQWLGVTEDRVHLINSGKDCNIQHRKFQFLILSYNFVGKLREQLEELDPKLMVLDESHCIKSKTVSDKWKLPASSARP